MTQNETSAPPLTNINGIKSIPAGTNIDGISIADQLVAAGKTWKSYQEGLPIIGADGVNVSDGFFTVGGPNAAGIDVTSNFAALSTPGNPVTADNVVYLYAVKHNPFAYFASVQEGVVPQLSLKSVASFEGQRGLFADLKAGTVPDFAFIAPNQCNDMHGRGNGTAFCNYDADDNGTQTGLNPSLILQGDQSVQRIVTAIKASAYLVRQQECDRHPVGRERLQHDHLEPGRDDRRYELRPAQDPELQVLRSLLADQDARRRIRPALPEPCLRCRRGK